MADPKYANLPGIAHDQPDLYETSDLPEADQNREDELEVEESEFIEKLHLNAPTAYSKFKGKSLGSDYVDFSDRLSKARRIGYDARSGDWELAGIGDKETPMQRYERLKLELKELFEDLNSLKDSESKEVDPASMLTNVEKMIFQLEGLKLEQLPESDKINLTDPQGTQMRKLLGELDQTGKGVEHKSNVDGKGGEIRYSVLAHPSQASMVHSSRIASLEEKVNNLNAVISSSKKISGERNLVDIARDVESKMTLLQSAHLEAADSRVAALVLKMDQVQDRMSAITQKPTSDKDTEKINELYDLAKTSEQFCEILPSVIDRMTTLESIHNQALEFSKSKSELETLQCTLRNACESNKHFLQRIDENFTKNITALKNHVESLDNRLKAITSSKKK